MTTNSQRIGRAVVRSHPQVIYVAAEACVLHLYLPTHSFEGDRVFDNPEVVVSVDAEPAIPYGDENTAVLPFAVRFPVYLDEGQVLWAVSSGQATVTFSVIPAPLDVVGW